MTPGEDELMPDRKRKPTENAESDLGLEGFENFFDGTEKGQVSRATTTGDPAAVISQQSIDLLIGRFGELITLTVDQRVETSKIANQLIENQRQLIATQQILIRLMERSIDLARHITALEEKLPAIFELPRIVDSLRNKVAQLEGIEVD
jgi:hypothetical protein